MIVAAVALFGFWPIYRVGRNVFTLFLISRLEKSKLPNKTAFLITLTPWIPFGIISILIISFFSFRFIVTGQERRQYDRSAASSAAKKNQVVANPIGIPDENTNATVSQIPVPTVTTAVTEMPDTLYTEMIGAARPYLGVTSAAPVMIVMFTEPQDPFTKKFVEETWYGINARYVANGKAKFVIRYTDVLSGAHKNARSAAEFIWCADEQGKFFDTHDKFIRHQEEWASLDDPTPKYYELGDAVGLDRAKQEACFVWTRKKGILDEDHALSQKLGIVGVPRVYVNKTAVTDPNNFAQFVSLIESTLNSQ
ncbi:hypothetical protein A2Z33_04510 [Candidatus Gottesmanbacteria bacterium RBG_16_52_11]|uniref:Thioredoxin-like fold domain-containing protein n=1 Tax=Candidatus Gottesmanbacteria bacterium RBG_16_52_11 TaxID=1798374 RepID=A0A1F5YWA5_9BACT|nr:MAG: hypothetical protein A2Z33_04510 [Candidatus Gottesmanbacteria bacterium RBG_16_52_11]